MATSLNISFKPTPANLKEFFKKEFKSAKGECVSIFNKNSVYYVLIKTKDMDFHYCFVILTKVSQQGTHLHYKVMESSSEPYYYDVPAKWIPLLDKSKEEFISAGFADAFEGTANWLVSCKNYQDFNSKLANMRIGTSFEFKNPFEFKGFSESKFFYAGDVTIGKRTYQTFKPQCKDLRVRLPSISDLFSYFQNENLTIC